MKEKIIAPCGNDCSVCPRYHKPPFEKTEEELHNTALLWAKIGYRDHIVTNEEIACTGGCCVENRCRYRVAECVQEHGVSSCGLCPEYPCETIRLCFITTDSFMPACRKACTEAEFSVLRTAFFEKEKNLNVIAEAERTE